VASEDSNSTASALFNVHEKCLATSMDGYPSNPVKPAESADMIAQGLGSIDQSSMQS
jgi:CheY-like chemotaxis protein